MSRSTQHLVLVSQGFEATLERLSSPSLFGNDIYTVLLTGEYQTPNRFRFKVSPWPVLLQGPFSLQDVRLPVQGV